MLYDFTQPQHLIFLIGHLMFLSCTSSFLRNTVLISEVVVLTAVCGCRSCSP